MLFQISTRQRTEAISRESFYRHFIRPMRQSGLRPEMGNSNSGVDAFLLGVGLELELILLIRDGVGVELELALFSNSDSTPIDLMTSKRPTKKTT